MSENQKYYDVLGIGNAIVDVIAKVEDAFLVTHGLAKSAMTLINEQQALALYEAMPPAIEVSGGSAANTMAGIASLGGKVAFIGKVRNDTLGEIFAHDLKAAGVHYETLPAIKGESTARCLISVTPDAMRTMATYLGATRQITIADIDESLIAKSKVVYLEGYLWDESAAKEAMRHAMNLAKQHQCKIAFSLSDLFCVERHRAEFLEFIDQQVDILFANEAEILALYQQTSLEPILALLQQKKDKMSVVTRGAEGSVIIADRAYHIAAQKKSAVIDTTGAGDLYASGLLYGYVKGYDWSVSGKIASIAAAEIISHVGARPEISLELLVSNQDKLTA